MWVGEKLLRLRFLGVYLTSAIIRVSRASWNTVSQTAGGVAVQRPLQEQTHQARQLPEGDQEKTRTATQVSVRSENNQMPPDWLRRHT